jgi:CRISPR-associated exonuclease Cas4
MERLPNWNDAEIIPISALSHHLYCPRQNALIHVEGVFQDNEHTVSGNIGHSYIDEDRSVLDHGLRKETSLPVFSDLHGLNGIADLVEFPKNAPPFPVDYKNGRVQSWKNQEAQLCAVALCLEEMLGYEVPEGAIYHIHSRRRRSVRFDQNLRMLTLRTIDEIREVLTRRILPAPVYDRRCKRCSLASICMPQANPESNLLYE